MVLERHGIKFDAVGLPLGAVLGHLASLRVLLRRSWALLAWFELLLVWSWGGLGEARHQI